MEKMMEKDGKFEMDFLSKDGLAKGDGFVMDFPTLEEWNDGDPGGGSDGLAAADGKVVSSFIGAQCDEADRKDL